MYFIELCDLEYKSHNPTIESVHYPYHMHAQGNSEAGPAIHSEVIARMSHFYVFYCTLRP